jgi:hypothetical protein
MTRWAMNYLAGPLTRTQISGLNQLMGVDKPGTATQPPQVSAPQKDEQTGLTFVPIPQTGLPTQISAVEHPLPGSTTRPAVPSGIDEYFLPNNLTISQAAKSSNQTLPANTRLRGLLYRPALLAQAEIRFMQRKYNLDHEQTETALVLEANRRGTARWDDWLSQNIDPQSLDRRPAPQARFDILEAPLNDGSTLRALRADFVDWAYRNVEVKVRANEKLKVYAGPTVSQSEFRRLCVEAARALRNGEMDKIEARYEKKLDRIEDRLHREERELRQDEAELTQRRMEEYGTHAENVLSLFTRRSRRLSTSLSKRRMTERAEADVEESLEAIEDYKQQIADLEKELKQAVEEVQAKWAEIADDMEEIPVNPYKKDILIDLFGVAWFPYHVVEIDGQTIELPGFGTRVGG